MNKPSNYNPKFSRDEEAWEQDTWQQDTWQQDSWQTGSTEPPKSHSPMVALLLTLVIFLCGIITVLGILNIRLFTQLNVQKEADTSISFTDESTMPTQEVTVAEETAPAEMEEPVQTEASLAIAQSPVSPDYFPQAGGLSLQEIYQKNIPSVVSITSNLRKGSSTGTGVIFSADGYIVTNAHVVEDAVSASVRLTDDRIFQANLVGTDEISDLAVLYIDADNLQSAEFGDSSMLRVGDSVTAIGDPLGTEFRGTFTDGIISAINRDVAVDGRTMNLIQTNAALNSGNSGGPLINCYGQVVGINTMKIGAFTDSAGVEGLGFAIPSATVKDIVDQIISQGYVSGRPTLGIEGETLSSFYQHYYHLPAGLYITDVDPGSYAAYCGIEQGDILLMVDDTRITNMDSLNTVLYNHAVGDVVAVTIYRGGKQATVELTLTEARG